MTATFGYWDDDDTYDADEPEDVYEVGDAEHDINDTTGWRDSPHNREYFEAHDRQDGLYVQGLYDDIEPKDEELL